eukprot:TRINITY_DN130_c0_g1_i1.p1 TRINITY_DN130_c0_g1~~TRINITY_DN130_c0_g1_i1.p1  ORF type:complete len:156 (-),score=47.69 TRINITY_DN130_c0_g1_i1:27-494(-)
MSSLALLTQRFTRRSMMTTRNEVIITRAKKKTGGKKRGKVKPEAPEGFSVEMMAKDWGEWEHGEKIDVSLPFTEDNMPQWVHDLVKDPSISRIHGNLSELELEKHGLRYSLRKLRENAIKEDNAMRAERKWDMVPSLQGTRTKKRKSLAQKGNLS